MKRRKWRWVSRDKTSPGTLEIWSGTPRPEMINGTFYQGMMSSTLFYVPEFHQLFGICPRPGQCIKVEFSAKKLRLT